MAGKPEILVERHGARGELVLNRPERRNRLTARSVQALQSGIEELQADEEISAILIRGAGGTFPEGWDQEAMQAEQPPVSMAHTLRLWGDLHAAIYACPKPIVGALEGAALAPGSSLALSCDILIAGEGARLHVSEVVHGSAAPINVIWLQLKFGTARALDLAVGAQPCSGRELVERGIAIKAVPDGRVVDEARAYTDRIAENDAAAMATQKQLLRHLVGIEDFRERIAQAMRLSFGFS